MKEILKNARIYTGNEVLDNHFLVIENKHITNIFPDNRLARFEGDARVVDLAGRFIAPAFIDLQIYGASGLLFNDRPSRDVLLATHEANLKAGTTRYQITLPTQDEPVMDEAMAVSRQALAELLPGFLGLHLEGPYINALKKGAHVEEFIQKPDLEKLKALHAKSKGAVVMLTLAPEYLSAEMLAFLRTTGWLLSAGHSNASYQEAVWAFDGGVTACTHLFNAMSPLQGRAPGLTGAVMDDGRVWASIIADGVHLDFASLRIAKAIMGERLFLITDGVTTSAGGRYAFSQGKNCFVNSEGILSGSSLTMLEAVKNCVTHAGIELEEALRMASTCPARLAGLTNLGEIKPGNLADLVILTEDLVFDSVYYEGQKQV